MDIKDFEIGVIEYHERLKEEIREYYPNDHIVFYSFEQGHRKTYIEFSAGTRMMMAIALKNGKLLKIYELKGAHEL